MSHCGKRNWVPDIDHLILQQRQTRLPHVHNMCNLNMGCCLHFFARQLRRDESCNYGNLSQGKLSPHHRLNMFNKPRLSALTTIGHGQMHSTCGKYAFQNRCLCLGACTEAGSKPICSTPPQAMRTATPQKLRRLSCIRFVCCICKCF